MRENLKIEFVFSEPPPGGLRAAGHGPDASRNDCSRRTGSGHVAPGAFGPSPSLDRDNEAFLKIARAM